MYPTSLLLSLNYPNSINFNWLLLLSLLLVAVVVVVVVVVVIAEVEEVFIYFSLLQ